MWSRFSIDSLKGGTKSGLLCADYYINDSWPEPFYTHPGIYRSMLYMHKKNAGSEIHLMKKKSSLFIFFTHTRNGDSVAALFGPWLNGASDFSLITLTLVLQSASRLNISQ